ncbi:MAG TPA: hypothetical protein V6D07_06055 [Trichocoleus sp.]
MRAPVLALCSVATFAALRPPEKVYVVAPLDTDTIASAQDADSFDDDGIELVTSARSPQPDAFIYEFLRSEELAATDLFANQTSVATKSHPSAPATVSLDPFKRLTLADADSTPVWLNAPAPSPTTEPISPQFSSAFRASS